jgi:hypothetical protein
MSNSFIPPPPTSGSVHLPQQENDAGYVRNPESAQERGERWFLGPLRNLEDRDNHALAVLTLLFPVYEAYLRSECPMRDDERFTKGHKVLKMISRSLKIPEDQAYVFWQSFRNPLMHKANLREQAGTFNFLLIRDGDPISVSGTEYRINPWALRDILIAEFENKPTFWNDLGIWEYTQS